MTSLNPYILLFFIVALLRVIAEESPMKRWRNIDLIIMAFYILQVVIMSAYLVSNIDVLISYDLSTTYIVLIIVVLFVYSLGFYRIAQHYKMWKNRDTK